MVMRWINIGALALLGFVALPAAPAGAKTSTFVAILNGGQETPPVTTDNFGVGFLTFDTKTKMLCFSINYDDLHGSEQAAHVHGPATPGTAAGILFTLPLGKQKNGCVGTLTGSQTRDLKKGMLYVNVHSSRDPNGEIRGQILPAGR